MTRRPTTLWRRCIRWGGSVRSTMSSTPSCTWRTRRSSPARYCTWMVVKVRDTEVVREVIDRWKAGIDACVPYCNDAVSTENAIFQGLHPYSVGRQGVIDYYAA